MVSYICLRKTSVAIIASLQFRGLSGKTVLCPGQTTKVFCPTCAFSMEHKSTLCLIVPKEKDGVIPLCSNNLLLFCICPCRNMLWM